MTTIACDGKSMAGDGQREACRTILTTNAVKVQRLGDGRIVGTCGDTALATKLVDWLNGKGDKPEGKAEDDFAALVLGHDGVIEYISGHCIPTIVPAPVAVGSGMDFAIGAMEAGKTPFEAVQIACRRDPNSGGTITMLETSLLQVAA